MDQQQVCKAIGLTCSPSLGLYSHDVYYILPFEFQADIPPLPFQLVAELHSNRLKDVQMTYGTVVSDGSFLANKEQEKVAVNVLFHSYVFYDATEGSNHRCFLPAAVYLPDSMLSTFGTPPCDKGDFLRTNPSSVFSEQCSTEVFMHPRDQDMCCSPDNAKVLINRQLPVVVFYTLCLVPYKGKIVRGNVTRHVVAMNENSIFSIEVLGLIKSTAVSQRKKSILSNIDEMSILTEILTEIFLQDGATSVYETFLHYIAWELSGRPDVPRFGSTEVEKHYLAVEDPISAAWIKNLIISCAYEVAKWLQALN